MGLFSKKQDNTAGGATGLFSKLSIHRHSTELGHDHIVLRLVPVSSEGLKDAANVTVAPAGAALSSRYMIQITSPDNQPLPDFGVGNDYAGWSNKVFASDEDKETNRRCWAHLKHTRVLDIIGTAPAPVVSTPGGTGTRRAPDELAIAEVQDALSPAPADLHDAPHTIDSNDPLVMQLRWFCDALQNLEIVRYIGIPPSEAFVKLFSDVERKIVFPAIDGIAPLTVHPPEVSPGASTRVVSNVEYAPALGLQRVPLQYDYPTSQELTYAYIFPGVKGAKLGLEHDSWRRFIREVAGILTYFQDMPPDVQLVDFPLADGVAPTSDAVDPVLEESDVAAQTTEESRAHAAIVSEAAASAAAVDGIEGTIAGSEAAAPVGPAVGQPLTNPVAGSAVPPTPTSTAPAPASAATNPTATTAVPATKASFLAALAHRLTLNTNDPDHIKDMIGTGSNEGAVQDALSHVFFLTRDEYERQLGAPEFELETRV